ncbi:uncharacterized protein PADG_05259 [Paracoccidioides brasiliensis Pb18]|uniref:Uncharacterized protein n=1 Tax=Paracoccidioides brasiliensis (strain Pb18) TaxID=502780 RepID=C1GDC3_PARBD|nr:uncharacterized protein PADG_05259 [Paracoccidioides brasiliensis Pb18]EEH49180.1 hypothetical protein PADG_05259 [Paracoccidioides brasiliensis Pb18]
MFDMCFNSNGPSRPSRSCRVISWMNRLKIAKNQREKIFQNMISLVQWTNPVHSPLLSHWMHPGYCLRRPSLGKIWNPWPQACKILRPKVSAERHDILDGILLVTSLSADIRVSIRTDSSPVIGRTVMYILKVCLDIWQIFRRSSQHNEA